MTRSFEGLVAEGDAEPTEGWVFSWFEGRATEERPSWGYARSAAPRVCSSTAVLDIQTGGGVTIVADHDALPFDDASFDLVISRHPTFIRWDEVGRVLQAGGTYYAQH